MLGHPGEQYVMQDYEILMLMLSVSSFERHNGPVSMYADDAAASFLESEKIDDIFSRGIKMLKVPEDIDPKVYWAAGKLYALKAEKLTVCHDRYGSYHLEGSESDACRYRDCRYPQRGA